MADNGLDLPGFQGKGTPGPGPPLLFSRSVLSDS